MRNINNLSVPNQDFVPKDRGLRRTGLKQNYYNVTRQYSCTNQFLPLGFAKDFLSQSTSREDLCLPSLSNLVAQQTNNLVSALLHHHQQLLKRPLPDQTSSIKYIRGIATITTLAIRRIGIAILVSSTQVKNPAHPLT